MTQMKALSIIAEKDLDTFLSTIGGAVKDTDYISLYNTLERSKEVITSVKKDIEGGYSVTNYKTTVSFKTYLPSIIIMLENKRDEASYDWNRFQILFYSSIAYTFITLTFGSLPNGTWNASLVVLSLIPLISAIIMVVWIHDSSKFVAMNNLEFYKKTLVMLKVIKEASA